MLIARCNMYFARKEGEGFFVSHAEKPMHSRMSTNAIRKMKKFLILTAMNEAMERYDVEKYRVEHIEIVEVLK